MPSPHLICGAGKQTRQVSLANLLKTVQKATSVSVSSTFDRCSQPLYQKLTAFVTFKGHSYRGLLVTDAHKAGIFGIEDSVGKGLGEGLREGLGEGLGGVVNQAVSANRKRFFPQLGSIFCSRAMLRCTPINICSSSKGLALPGAGSIPGPTLPVRFILPVHVSQAGSYSTKRECQSRPRFTSVSQFDVLSMGTIFQPASWLTRTEFISRNTELTGHRLSTRSLHAQNKHAPPMIARSVRHYSSSEASSTYVSVRTPHGSGTEDLRKSTKGLQGLTPENLQRIDTDRAADSSSIVKDVLGGREKGGKEKQTFTPIAPPATDNQIQSLHDFIVDSERLLVVTGAGVSTESGIPDYRSPTGAYSTGFKPTTHQEFVRSAASRQRYWARSYFGWRRFSGTRPNETHRAIATLEERGRVRGGMITQNVDRLHHACGSDPLELHGTTHQVICMSCNNLSDRQEFQEKLAATNPQWIDSIEAAERGEDVLAGTPGLQRPDGDVEIGEEFLRKGLFRVPACEKCGADALKPDVVFFGDNVPKWRVDRAAAMVRDSDAMLVVGSSLMVLSAYRLARAAADDNIPIAILNVGPTRADDLATLRVGARSGEVFARLLNTGSLALPL